LAGIKAKEQTLQFAPLPPPAPEDEISSADTGSCLATYAASAASAPAKDDFR